MGQKANRRKAKLNPAGKHEKMRHLLSFERHWYESQDTSICDFISFTSTRPYPESYLS
jgi:hypothetical protein